MKMRTLRIEYQLGVPSPIFEGNDAEAWVREAFLREATSFLPQMMEVVTSAVTNRGHTVEFGGNEISFQGDADHLIVTSEWIRDESDNECVIRLPTEEAKQLLLRWREILDRRQK